MKTNLRIIILIVAGCLIIGGCKVLYHHTYYTYLENSPDESLQFKDSVISVIFSVKPNGISFDIKNLTKNNMYLIWDKSYFIDPKGNSSKALNTDVLETNKKILDKENYESVIPQGSHFARFTSSVKNLSLFDTYNSLTIYNEATKSVNSFSDYSEFYQTGTYWYLGLKRNYSSKGDIANLDKAEISLIQKFIPNNNELGMGFTLKYKEKELEYHFKFPIKKVEISRKLSSDYAYTLCYELSKNNGFTPVNLEKK